MHDLANTDLTVITNRECVSTYMHYSKIILVWVEKMRSPPSLSSIDLSFFNSISWGNSLQSFAFIYIYTSCSPLLLNILQTTPVRYLIFPGQFLCFFLSLN
jgi:hypothetical protein